jgi:CheY-like chemotaxis protein
VRTSPVSVSGASGFFTFPAGGLPMGKTLLLADDSITIQKVVGIIFANEVANEDYRLFIVDNGNEALDMAREVRPDVLLVDALMPGKSGYEVCEEVRRDLALKDTPILLLVGAFEPFDEDKAKSSGADDFITKPFESQSLIDKVKALIAMAGERVVAVSTQPLEEAPVAPPLQAVQEEPPAAAAANLADQFKGYIHLGGEPEQPREAEPTASEVLTFEPVVASVEKETEPEGVILLSSVDVVEAGPEDDPWGTFSEEVTEGEPIQFGEILEEEEQTSAADAVDVIEPFTFMDEEQAPAEVELTHAEDEVLAPNEFHMPAMEERDISEGVPASTGIAGFTSEVRPIAAQEGKICLGDEPGASEKIETVEPAARESVMSESQAQDVMPSDDTIFHFAPSEIFAPAEESLAAPDEIPASTESSLEPEIREGFEIPAPFGAVQDKEEFQFSPDEAFTPVEAAPAPQADVLAVPATPVETAPVVSLTEEQLAAAITRISREIIEKIAWDVVPDLAETIIKEEIRKIKEGLKN